MEKKTTLVVVDFQYDFCLLGAPLYVPGSDKALWNISHLIENKKVDRVIFTADWHPANHCSFKRNGGEWNDHCVQFSKGAAIHDLLLYGCISSGVPYRVLIKGELPSSEEYGVKVAPATVRVKYNTIYSNSIGIDVDPENDKLQDELTAELGPDVVGKITERRFKSRFKRLVSPIIVPREMYD